MTIKKSLDDKNVLSIINKFIGEKTPEGKGWFLVISNPSEIIIRRSGQRNVLEFEGLGKEIWDGVDVEKYISEERAAWD